MAPLTQKERKIHTKMIYKIKCAPSKIPNHSLQIPIIVLAQRRVMLAKRDDGLHAYKHQHLQADEASPPCRHLGGCSCEFIEVGAGFHWPASSGAASVRTSTGAARTSILESLVLVVVVGFLPVVPLQRVPRIWVGGGLRLEGVRSGRVRVG